MMPKQPRIASLALREQMNRRRPTTAKGSTLAKELSGKGKSGKLESSRKEADEGKDDDLEENYSPQFLAKENEQLRHRLEEEASNYRRRMETYRQAQQHQATLVSRLQAKVLQYKQHCAVLESQLEKSLPADGDHLLMSGMLPSQRILQAAQQTMREEQINNLDAALDKLREERARCEKLLQLNVNLKDQLEESHRTNEELTNDLQKLSSEWDELRDELATREDQWKEEEMAFNEYYNSEHARLLNLWRDVVSVKRLFSEMKFATERDLDKMRGQLGGLAQDTVAACSSTSFLMKLQQAAAASGVLNAAQGVMRSERDGEEAAAARKAEQAAKERLEQVQQDIRAKDEKIQQLVREVQALEDKCADAEAGVNQKLRLQEDIDVLQSALRDIAHAVIQDAETRDANNVQATPHVHLSPSGAMPLPGGLKRPARGNATPAFAESTISAVQAALHKYHLTIHELQVKLQTSKEQLVISRKQSEGLEERVVVLEEKSSETILQIDSLRSQNLQLSQEKEMLQKALDNVRNEKMNLDKSRIEYAGAIDNLSSDYEKIEKLNAKLEKVCRSLEDEKCYLQNEFDRVNKDCELRETSLRIEEERSSKLREEVLSLREELNRAQLARDVLEQQKLESDNYISQVEKGKGDLELDLERVLLEKSDLEELLSKIQTVCLSHEQDLARLQDELKKVNEEKNQLASQCSDQQNDLGSLRKELLQAEQTRLDLESEKVTLHEKMKFLEMEKEKVEMELAQVTRERGDLSNQLSILARKKETLNEEYMRLKQRYEQARETHDRLNRNLEDFVKDNEEKQVLLETSEKEIQRYQEMLASMRSEKESLEGNLFDTQSNLEATVLKKNQLEKDQQELLIKQESLKGEIQRLTKELENSEKHARDIKQNFTQMGEKQETEFQTIIMNIKRQSDDAIKKLNEEKEHTKVSLEKKLQQNLAQLNNEKDSEISQLNQRIEQLQNYIDNLCQQHEEVLLRAENDKQQCLLIAHQDQQVLIEKLQCLARELDEEKGSLDRLRRESTTLAEQDRNTINKLRDELNRLKNKLDESKLKADEEKLKLELKIEELRNERENGVKEIEELQVQLQMSEDKIDELHNQLQETNRKLKEAEVTIENSRKELFDVRRQLTESNYEKEKYHSTNEELRERIKQVEGDKREQARTLEEVYQKIAGLEDAKTSLENDRSRLQNNLRETEREIMQIQQQLRLTQEEFDKSQNANAQMQTGEKELQARLANEVEERERIQLQLHQTRKQNIELENNLEMTRVEMGKMRTRADEEDERFRVREQELLACLEDARCRERALEDQKHNLGVCLDDATQQQKELKAKLGGSEGRVRALDCQLSQMEAQKKEIEQKLSSVVLTLRRIAGIQLDGSFSMPFKPSSPSRRYSPVRMQEHPDGNREIILDIDPESVRRGVKSLMRQVAQIERERDDCKTELNGTKKQLIEAQENQSKIDTKLNILMANIRNLQDEKNALESKFLQKQTISQGQAEKLEEKIEECERLREKVLHLETALTTGCEEKILHEDKIEKMRQTINKLENDKRMLKEDLSKLENRCTQMEVVRMSLEGDLQRLQMIIAEKDANIQKLQERCEMQARTIASLEERCISLKGTIDQMNHSLEKAATTESEMKSEINHLNRCLMEINAHSQSDIDKMKQLQKQLSNAESDRRVLIERHENLQQSLNELRHANQMLSDQNTRLQNEVANSEVLRSGLEAQIRMSSNWPRDATGGGSNKDEELLRQLQTAQRERSELKGKVDVLQDKLKAIENDKRNLERQLSSARSSNIRSKSYERQEKAHSELLGSSFSLEQLEQENRDFRLKVRRLECQLAEKEAEIVRMKSQMTLSHSHSMMDSMRERSSEVERYRAAQLQAEKLLEAREQSHRQQVSRLNSEIQTLRDELAREMKRRSHLLTRSARTGREMQHIRRALGESLRKVSQDPSLDAVLLEHEARKLDNTVNSSVSLPPSLALPLPAPPSSLLMDRRSPGPSTIK